LGLIGKEIEIRGVREVADRSLLFV